jgi:hypothetical protein
LQIFRLPVLRDVHPEADRGEIAAQAGVARPSAICSLLPAISEDPQRRCRRPVARDGVTRDLVAARRCPAPRVGEEREPPTEHVRGNQRKLARLSPGRMEHHA